MPQLNVPYHTQLNNEQNPSGSCNVTSLAMCYRFVSPFRNFGKTDPNEQLEDYLYRRVEDEGLSRHSPEDLAHMSAILDVPHVFKPCESIEDIKASIDDGKPAIIHGYFTSFGHIVVVIGYTETGLVIHDPYGVYPYNTSDSGEAVEYPYSLINQTCAPDGCIWTHYLG